MGEIMEYTEETTVDDVLEETKTSLSELKESVDTNPQKITFAKYLKEKGINKEDFPRDSGLGKFLRTFRYYAGIKETATQHKIPLDHFFALKMIEGEGDPTNINVYDGWAGISQIQPDTFKQFSRDTLKRQYKVFSDDSKYKAWDYATLRKKYSRSDANALIAKKLVDIKENTLKSDFGKLTKLDDRFNPKIALDFSAQYLLHCKAKIDAKALLKEPLKTYATKYNGFDFARLLALNGYNKWPANYDTNVYDTQRDVDKDKYPNKTYTDHHLHNLTTRITQYRAYTAWMQGWIKQWLSGEALMNKFREKAGVAVSNVKPVAKIEKKAELIVKDKLQYVWVSKDKQWKIYKYAVLPPYTYNFYQMINIRLAFPGKTIEFTDNKGNLLTPWNAPQKKWDVLYIREKIVK